MEEGIIRARTNEVVPAGIGGRVNYLGFQTQGARFFDNHFGSFLAFSKEAFNFSAKVWTNGSTSIPRGLTGSS